MKAERRTDRFPEYLWLRTNLIRLRERRGWSQAELATHMDRLDQSYISALERMQVNPTLEVLSAIAHCLEVELAELVKPTLETPAERKARVRMEERAEMAQLKREADRKKREKAAAAGAASEEAAVRGEGDADVEVSAPAKASKSRVGVRGLEAGRAKRAARRADRQGKNTD